MGDDVDMTLGTLRRMYAEALSRAMLAPDPVRMGALVALASELRAAIESAAVVGAVAQPVSPWRLVATDPPAVDDFVSGRWFDARPTSVRYCDGRWWSEGGHQMPSPVWWMPIPPLAVAP